jgi:hypothetical protein
MPKQRRELRTLKAVTVNGFGLPHAAQVIQVTRKTLDRRGRRWRTMTVHTVTSLTFEQASPARLADRAIKNGLHHVRDVTVAEPGSSRRGSVWMPRLAARMTSSTVSLTRLAGSRPCGWATAPGRVGARLATPIPYDPRRTPGSSPGGTAPASPAAMVQPKACRYQAQWSGARCWNCRA